MSESEKQGSSLVGLSDYLIIAGILDLREALQVSWQHAMILARDAKPADVPALWVDCQKHVDGIAAGCLELRRRLLDRQTGIPDRSGTEMR